MALTGVSLLGIEDFASPYASKQEAALEIGWPGLEDALSWRPSVVRVAINRARVLRGTFARSALDYVAELDNVISRAAAAGAYTMLSLRRLDDDSVFGTLSCEAAGRLANRLAPQPDYDAVGMWRILAERYAEEPAVLFDLYSTPHPALSDDLSGIYSEWDIWALWIRLTIADMRRAHPRALCIVAGLDWATDLSGFPVLGTEDQPISNVIYAVHLRPQRALSMAPLRALARRHPVFVTEWSATDTEGGWGEATSALLQAEGLGWTAAHWAGEAPLARRGRLGEVLPSRFGAVVRRALAIRRELPAFATHPIHT